MAVAINIIFMAILAVAVFQAFCIFAGFLAVGVILYFIRKRQLGFAPSLISLKDKGNVVEQSLPHSVSESVK